MSHKKSSSQESDQQIMLTNIRLKSIIELYGMTESKEEDIYKFALASITTNCKCELAMLGIFSNGNPVVHYKTENKEAFNKYTARLDEMWIWNKTISQGDIVKASFLNQPQPLALPTGALQIHNYISIPYYTKGKLKFILSIANKEEPVKEEEIEIVQLFLEAISKIITEKEYKRELIYLKETSEENEKRLRNYFQLGLLGMAITSLDKGWIEVNETISDFLGYTKDELMRKTWSELTHPDDIDKDIDLFNSVLRGEREGYKMDKRFMRKDGGVIYSELSVNCVRDDNGKVKYFLALINDITERKLNETALKRAMVKARESDELKTQFLNNMSHEIRTPMNGIIGFSDLLNTPNISPEKRKYYSQLVLNSSNKLLQIIDDILEISTLETKQLKIHKESFCLNDLLMELFSIFDLKAKDRNIPIYIKKSLRDQESHIISDKNKIYKILHNLISNAIKFTNEGFVELGYQINNEELILYVKDTGIGIDEKAKDKIFERFSQESKEISQHHGGLGLGLSISRENAELLGGEITFTSKKGQGATFFVTIPYQPDQEKLNLSGISDLKNKAELNVKKYNILVAEDEEINYLYLETLLENISEQYNVIHARNGEEAVEICKLNKQIDIVLMDIKMPRLNGPDATKTIRNIRPQPPIIAQTAYSTSSDRKLAFEYGCDDFISKPIDKNKLFDLIDKYVS